MTSYKEILKLHERGVSNRDIATCLGCSRNTVAVVLEQAKGLGMSFEKVREMSEQDVSRLLYPGSKQSGLRKQPDFEHIHRELAKSGVTLNLLWNEYCGICRGNNDIPFMYTQFCKLYREFAQNTKATMHLEHKPGERLEVDWAGDKAFVTDSVTGHRIPANIFVATLTCSGYSYVEACPDQKQESWINAHIGAYRFFGGVTRFLVPDNLKTGVQSHSRDEVIINRVYQEMAEHYGTCVLPARVRKPRDKASVEKAVNVVSMWILASLRNQQFFSFSELNDAIQEKLVEFNDRPFQKRPGSRSIAFAEERAFLGPLPRHPYELSTWRNSVVQYNYCIAVERNYYSVPYAFIKRTVEVRITQNVVEVFHKGSRICSHPRVQNDTGQYRIVPEHMPESHRLYLDWNEEQFINWAHECGPNIAIVVESWFETSKSASQAYRNCSSLFRLGDKYSFMRLDAACERALLYTQTPSLKNIQSILKAGFDRLRDSRPETSDDSAQHGFTRGAGYYGGEEI